MYPSTPHPAWLDKVYDALRKLVPGAVRLEVVAIEDAWMRVTSADVIAQGDVPPAPIAACNGYAIRSADTAQASHGSPVELELDRSFPALASPSASPATRAIDPEHAVEVPEFTPLPAHADAVAPMSQYRSVYRNDSPMLVLKHPLPPGSNVIAAGSEYRKGDVILAAGERITAGNLARLIAAGVREVTVAKRLRIGVVTVSYEHQPPASNHDEWRRPDAAGPYIRATLRGLGYDVPPVEYLSPLDETLPPIENQHNYKAYQLKLAELAQRYDLIIGAGMPHYKGHCHYGLNGQTMYSDSKGIVEIAQIPGGQLNFGNGDARSPATSRQVDILRADGSVGGSQTLTSHDVATLINLPGYIGSVAVLMRSVLPRLLDLLEYVAIPGPCWEIGRLAHDVECDVSQNQMRWGQLYPDGDGGYRVGLLPAQPDAYVSGLSEADVLVAIPTGASPLPADSAVHLLRLNRAGDDRPRVACAPLRTESNVKPVVASATTAHTSAPTSEDTDIHATWRRIDHGRAIDQADNLYGLNGPASAEAINKLQQAFDVQLPSDLIESLRIHDGQSEAAVAFQDADTLLDAAGIVTQWSIWRGLVDSGAFDGMESEADSRIKPDWYNLGWIPFTHDGSGNHLCVDLDPGEDGVVGQVIRVWHDEGEREWVAQSYAAWLADVAGQ